MKNAAIIYNIIEVDKLRKVIRGAAALVMAVTVIGGAAVLVATDPRLPINADIDTAPLEKLTEVRRVIDENGREIFAVSGYGKLRADVRSLPDYTLNAFIAVEDARFYEHEGFDPRRIAAAAVRDILTMSAREGASTITQQLAKNSWLTSEKTLSRKLKELAVARMIEKKASKTDILGMYLNSVYFGRGVYGIESAALRYFGIGADELDLGQSAMLAGIINSPRTYDPVSHKDAAERRKKLVLSRMLECGYITESQMIDASRPTAVSGSPVNGSIFAAYALSGGEDSVVTNYSENIQRYAVRAVEELAADVPATVSVIIMDAKTERLVAAAANTYADISGARRQAGSIVKPLLCYAPAMDMGIITSVTPLLDKPDSFGGWRPSNYGGLYYGWVTATESLSRSLNIPAVRLLEAVGEKRAKEYAEKFGLGLGADDGGLSLALGSSKRGVRIMDVARSYCKLARGGGGVVSADTAYLINEMLSECARTGTAKALKSVGVAAKTGTAGGVKGNTDAYCVAYNPRYVVVAWAGADGCMLPSDITGGTLPAEICAAILSAPACDGGSFSRPDTVVRVEIDAERLETDHTVVRACAETPPRYRRVADFSIYNMPGAKIDTDMLPINGDNFRIVDAFNDEE